MSSSDGNGGNGGHSESNNGSISGNRGITGQPNLASWSTQGHSQAVGSKAQHSNQKNNNRKKVNKNTRMEDGSPSDQADHKKAKKQEGWATHPTSSKEGSSQKASTQKGTSSQVMYGCGPTSEYQQPKLATKRNLLTAPHRLPNNPRYPRQGNQGLWKQ